MTTMQPPNQPHPDLQQQPQPAVVEPQSAPQQQKRRTRGGATTSREVGKRVVNADAPAPAVNHTLYAVEGVVATSAFVHLADLDPTVVSWTVGGAAVIGAIALGTESKVKYDDSLVTQFTVWTTLATGGAIAIATIFSPFSLPGLAAIGGVSLAAGPIYGLLRWRSSTAVQKELARREEEKAQQRKDDWEALLESIGAKEVVIDPIDDPEDGWVKGRRETSAGFALALDLGEKTEGQTLATLTPKIEQVAARRFKLPINTGSIQVSQRGYAHEWEMIIPTRDVLREDYRIEIPDGPRSVNDGITVSYGIDGPITLDLMADPHGLISGQTNYGKSNYLDGHAVQLTPCEDNVTWVICGDKANRFFASWMAPFLNGETDPDTGEPLNPPFDWIASDIEEACMMLCDIIKAIHRRQATAGQTGETKWTPSPDAPRITLLIDESVSLFEKEKYKVKPCNWEGNTHEEDEEAGITTGRTFGELVAETLRLARSEAISEILSVSRSTSTMIGENGGDLKSQVGYRSGFRDTGGSDTTAIFNTETNGVKTEELPAGGHYVEMGGFSRPTLAKAGFVSKDDKEYVARHLAKYCGPIDTYTAIDLDFYDGRWTRPRQQDFIRSLVPNPVRTVPGETVTSSTVQDGEQDDEPGTDLGNEDGDAPVVNTAATVDPDDEQASTDYLEELFAMPAQDRPEPAAPAAPRDSIDPSLPDDTRDLLGLLAGVGAELLYNKWVLSDEILHLAIDELAWPGSKTGYQRIKTALWEVSVEQPRTPPKVGGVKQGRGYWAADLREALDRRRVDEHN